MCIGAEICEAEYEEERRNRYYDDFDEYDLTIFVRKKISKKFAMICVQI